MQPAEHTCELSIPIESEGTETAYPQRNNRARLNPKAQPSRPLVEAIENIIAASLEPPRFTWARVEHVVIGNATVRGDLQHASLFVGRVGRRVALRAPCRRVRRKDEAVRPAMDESVNGRTGECDVRETGEERDPPFTGDGRRVSEWIMKGKNRDKNDRTYCSVGALWMPALKPGGRTE